MSDDLRERLFSLILQEHGVTLLESESEEIIAMFKQDAVEAVEDKLRFGSTNCCQNLLKIIKEL